MKKHAKQKSTHGSAMIEFALVLPMLLILVFGIIEFSIALYDKAVMTNASREAARAGAIFRTPALTNEQIITVATDACGNNLVSFANSSPQVTISKPGGATAGNPITVTITYEYTGLLLGELISPLTGTANISASTTMLIE